MNRTVRLVIVVAMGAVLLSILTLAALPYWFGHRAEKTYRALLDELTLTTGLPVTLKRYERGWRHSTAETDIALPALALTLTVRHTLQHGPWTEHGWVPLLARVSGGIHFASTANHLTPAPLTLQGDVDLRGAVRLSFDWPATQLAWAGGNLQWQPLHATLHADRDGNRVQGQIGGPALQVGDRHAEHWQIQFNVRPNDTAFPLGQLNLKIGRLTAPPFWEAAALQLSVSSHPTGETVALKLNGQIEKLRMAEEFYGPGEFVLEARMLEPVALIQFMHGLPTLFRADATTATLASPLAALARKAPAVELATLHLRATPDALVGKGRAVLDGRRLGATPHPARLLGALNGELTLSVSTPFLTSWLLADTGTENTIDTDQKQRLTEETLSRYIAAHPLAHLFTPTETGYRLTVTLKRGQLLINDKPWHGPLPSP